MVKSHGKINIGLLEKSILRDNNYVIFRKKIEYISNDLLTNSVLITSELGNGKTIFLKESLPILRKKYKHIYVIEEYTSDILKKIEETCNQFKNELIIFVIDDYNYFIPLLTYIMNFNLSNIRFLLSSRTSKHYKHKQLFLDKKIRLLSYSLDRLNDNEIKSFIGRLDTIGFWKKEYFSLYKKEELLKENCNKQISSILLEIFNSEEIKRKIEELKLELFKNEAIKELTFVSLFIGTIFSKIYRSTLYSIIGNNAYSEEIISNENFTSIFHVTISEIKSFSKVFNQKFLQEFYDPDYTISKLFNIATKTSKYSKQDITCREILKHCLKFSVIESIFPDEQKRKKIIYYYDQIKRNVKWLENDPHYWLQYGMGYLSFKEYEMAEKYFNYAYNRAKNKGFAYDVENIDTQYARLYFMKAIDEDEITSSFSLFKKGHQLICDVSNSKYKYRQLIFYQEYYRAKYLILENYKNKFFEMCKEVKMSLDKESIVDSSEEALMLLRIEELENIIKHIKEGVGIFTPIK